MTDKTASEVIEEENMNRLGYSSADDKLRDLPRLRRLHQQVMQGEFYTRGDLVVFGNPNEEPRSLYALMGGKDVSFFAGDAAPWLAAALNAVYIDARHSIASQVERELSRVRQEIASEFAIPTD